MCEWVLSCWRGRAECKSPCQLGAFLTSALHWSGAGCPNREHELTLASFCDVGPLSIVGRRSQWNVGVASC